MNLDTPKVSAIIVTYNPDVKILISLIEGIVHQVTEVILVDNNSNNSSELTNINDSIKNLKLIELGENKGLAFAQNIGIKESSEQTDFILLFDQDSIVENDFVYKQIDCYNALSLEGKKVAAIGPSFIDRSSKYKYPATVYKGPFLKRIPINNIATESTFIIASGSLIPKHVLKTVGLMLDDFFIDFVDVEWSLRARKHGLISYINPTAQMEHSIGDLRIVLLGRMISLHSDFRKFYIYRNGIFMTRLDYIPVGYKIRVIIFNLIRTFLGVIVSDHKLKSIKASYAGWISGFKKFDKQSNWE